MEEIVTLSRNTYDEMQVLIRDLTETTQNLKLLKKDRIVIMHFNYITSYYTEPEYIKMRVEEEINKFDNSNNNIEHLKTNGILTIIKWWFKNKK